MKTFGTSSNSLDPNDINFQQAVHAALSVPPLVTAPAANATGVSKTTTVTTAKNQPIDFYMVGKSSSQNGVGANTYIDIAGLIDGNMTFTNNSIVLKAGKTYELKASLALDGFSDGFNGGWGTFSFYDSTNNTELNSLARAMIMQTNRDADESNKSGMYLIYTPTVDTSVRVRCTGSNGTFNVRPNFTTFSAKEFSQSKASYVHGGTRVQIRNKATQVIVYDSGEIAGLVTPAVSPALAGSTQFEVRVMHKDSGGYWLRWSDWQTFTTTA